MARLGRRAILGGMAGALVAGPALAMRVGRPAPGFSLTTMDRRKVALNDLKGQVVVLDYWATWCGPCKLQLVVIENYLRTHPGSDLKVFGVTTDSDVPNAKLKPLASILSFPLVVQFSSWDYGLINNELPTTYVIDRSGVLRHAGAGAFGDAEFAALVTPLLDEPAPVLSGPMTKTS